MMKTEKPAGEAPHVCASCGASVGQAKFCPECGEPVSGPRGASCADCGHKPEGDPKFCPECGAKIAAC